MREHKPSLLPIQEEQTSPSSSSSTLKALAVHRIHPIAKWTLLLALPLYVIHALLSHDQVSRLTWGVEDFQLKKETCVQVTPLRPEANLDFTSRLNTVYAAENFSAKAAEWLGGAVRVPTEVFDDNGAVGEDPRWEIFGDFYQYLEKAFPKVHAELSLNKINTYALLYEWRGSDPTLKPILLMNHQDVVPVDPSTYSQWHEPPFSGVLKDGLVWGRGSCDDKSGVIGNLAAVESLLEVDFKPKRTIVLAFGIDEEVSGTQGAGMLAKHLLENGPKEFAFILDEGGGYGEVQGQVFAGVGVAEKGYLDVEIKVNTLGGHSSVPPPHTAIGLLSLLIARLESRTHSAHLTRESTMFDQFQCLAAHAPDMPDELRRDILKARKNDKALKRMETALLDGDSEQSRFNRAILSTTQAVDLISGGVKINALPEEVYAVVNHRISTDSSVRALQDSITAFLQPVAAQYNLSLNSFGQDVYSSPTRAASIANVTLSVAYNSALEPAPVTPTDTEAWRLLSGTIRAAYEDVHGSAKDVVVTPSMPGGNTDTKSYWALSRNIYRYGHIGRDHVKHGVHTVNEAIALEGFVDKIKFYSTLILNADEATSI